MDFGVAGGRRRRVVGRGSAGFVRATGLNLGRSLPYVAASPPNLTHHAPISLPACAPDSNVLATSVLNKRTEKHHWYLSEDLLNSDYASSQFDLDRAWAAIERLRGTVLQASTDHSVDNGSGALG